MENFAVATVCEDHLYESFGCKKLVNSFKHFYPDNPIKVFGTDEVDRIKKQYPGFDHLSFYCIAAFEAKKLFGVDLIVFMDADSMVLSPMDELFGNDYDIMGVRNNNEGHTQDESHNRPHPIKNLPNQLFVNAGFVATRSDDFLIKWYEINKHAIFNLPNGIKSYTLVEQDTYNILFHSKQYKTKILDSYESDVFYGPSSMYSTYSKPVPPSVAHYGRNHWESWKEIYLKDGQPTLYNKKVRVLHHCCGGGPKAKKLQYDLFNDEMVEYIKYVTKCEV